MRMRLVARDILLHQMARKGWSNRALAEFVGCAPGTIDNLVAGRTQSLNGRRTAQLISEALGLPVEVFFVPVLSSAAVRDGKSRDGKSKAGSDGGGAAYRKRTE